jgi:hypothetical protein
MFRGVVREKGGKGRGRKGEGEWMERKGLQHNTHP